MSIKINYLKKTNNIKSVNLVLFVNDKFGTNNLKKFISRDEISYINDLLKNSDLKKKHPAPNTGIKTTIVIGKSQRPFCKLPKSKHARARPNPPKLKKPACNVGGEAANFWCPFFDFWMGEARLS